VHFEEQFLYADRCTLRHSYRPFVDNVTCSSEETLRVWYADVTLTCFIVQTPVMCVNDVDDILFITAETRRLVFTRRGTKSYTIHILWIDHLWRKSTYICWCDI